MPGRIPPGPLCLLGLLGACIYPGPQADSAVEEEDPAAGASIYDVRGGGVEEGNTAILRGVVVSAPLLPDRKELPAGFFIQDPSGGPESGLAVYIREGIEPPTIEPGDRIDITGTIAITADEVQLWLTRDAAVSRTGTARIEPEPLALPVEDWEPWESVLITLADETVLGCPDAAGEVPLSSGIMLGGPYVEADATLGDSISQLTGVLSGAHAREALWPRSREDLHGFSPGEGCSFTVAGLRESGLVGEMHLPGVVVTAGPSDAGLLFVQDPGGGAGLQVSNARGLPVEEGALLRLQGLVQQVGQNLELRLGSSEVLGEQAPVVTALDPLPEDLSPYEGALVRLQRVKVTSRGEFGAWETDVGILLDDELLSPLPVATEELLDAVTGILVEAEGGWSLLPRREEDLAR